MNIPFAMNGNSYLIAEIPEGYTPSNLYPFSTISFHSYITCITPNGNSELVKIPDGHYKLIGAVDEITELEGQKFNPPTGCHKNKFCLLSVLKECKECKKEQSTKDYNGHSHYVCNSCYESLTREFESEYN